MALQTWDFSGRIDHQNLQGLSKEELNVTLLTGEKEMLQRMCPLSSSVWLSMVEVSLQS